MPVLIKRVMCPTPGVNNDFQSLQILSFLARYPLLPPKWLYHTFLSADTKTKFPKKTNNQTETLGLFFLLFKKITGRKKTTWGKTHFYQLLPWLFALNAVTMSGGVAAIWQPYFNMPLAKTGTSCQQGSRTFLVKLLSGTNSGLPTSGPLFI